MSPEPTFVLSLGARMAVSAAFVVLASMIRLSSLATTFEA